MGSKSSIFFKQKFNKITIKRSLRSREEYVYRRKKTVNQVNLRAKAKWTGNETKTKIDFILRLFLVVLRTRLISIKQIITWVESKSRLIQFPDIFTAKGQLSFFTRICAWFFIQECMDFYSSNNILFWIKYLISTHNFSIKGHKIIFHCMKITFRFKFQTCIRIIV